MKSKLIYREIYINILKNICRNLSNQKKVFKNNYLWLNQVIFEIPKTFFKNLKNYLKHFKKIHESTLKFVLDFISQPLKIFLNPKKIIETPNQPIEIKKKS
jgi:hypothetical protein